MILRLIKVSKTLFIGIIFLGLTGCQFFKEEQKPNVILFLVDDLGWKDLSCTGSEFYETPNIDSLATRGARFVNSYAAHPRCVPSRYATFTGKYPARAHIPKKTEQMPLSEITLGEAMKAAGYTTFFTGKWHLGHTESHWPQNQGFDINVGGCSAGAPRSYFAPFNELKANRSHKAKDIVGLEDAPEGKFLTELITEASIDFIKSHKDSPFFACIAHYSVHTPIEAKEEQVLKYKEKKSKMEFDGEPFTFGEDGRVKMFQDHEVYAAMVESVDESLGEIINTLREEGIADNTIIIFTSDHGGLSNSGLNNKRELATSNLPLRAGKGHLYEGGIKIPTIVYWNKHTKSGDIIEDIVTGTDIYPSILEMAGVDKLPEQHVDGVSFVSAIKGKKPDNERFVFWHSPMARPQSTGDYNCTVVRQGNYKLFHFFDTNKFELYDLETDPYETTNIAELNPKITNELFAKIVEWKNDINNNKTD
jgi:arylsulfatase A-like enzyme